MSQWPDEAALPEGPSIFRLSQGIAHSLAFGDWPECALSVNHTIKLEETHTILPGNGCYRYHSRKLDELEP